MSAIGGVSAGGDDDAEAAPSQNEGGDEVKPLVWPPVETGDPVKDKDIKAITKLV